MKYKERAKRNKFTRQELLVSFLSEDEQPISTEVPKLGATSLAPKSGETSIPPPSTPQSKTSLRDLHLLLQRTPPAIPFPTNLFLVRRELVSMNFPLLTMLSSSRFLLRDIRKRSLKQNPHCLWRL